MRTRSDIRPNRKNDRKVFVAEESTKSWADTDSESSSSSSSSRDSEQEEVHCLMADQASDDEVFDFSNVEFTRKAPRAGRTLIQNPHPAVLHQEIVNKRSEGETSTQSQSAYDKFNKMSLVKANVIYDCFESITFDDQNTPKLSDNGKAGIGFQRPENSKPSWLNNKLDKDKEKAGSKSFVPNQPRRNSRKAKSGWTKTQPRRDLSGQKMKSKLNRSHYNYAQTLTDPNTGKTMKVIQVWVPKGVREDGMVVSTIRGTAVEISESMFAAAFALPTEGLTDLSDVPKNLVFDARSLFFESKEQAKGFSIQVSVLLKNVPGLDLGESRAFPIPRVLTEKTVHRFVAINEKVGVEDVTDEPRVRKTPVKKAVSQKRPAVGVEAALVVKKKRTTKGKPMVIAQEAVPLQIVEAIANAPVEQPLVLKRKSQKRKRRLVLSADDGTVAEQPASEVESTVEKQPAITVAPATGVQDPVDENFERVDEPVPESVEQPAITPVVEAATDDPDAIIEEVLDQLDSVAANQDSGDQPTATIDETIPWYDLSFEFAIRDSERLFETGSDTEDDMDLDEGNQELPVGSGTDAVVGTDVGNQQEQSFDANTSRTDAEDYLVEESDEELVPETEQPSADEALSLEDILMTIPVGVPLPSAGVEMLE
ncbi:rho GTPase-activating protein 7-like [Dorcoceras hygrometricum]|uniref:Rho GTPase-activating protein 7-like n=1 Tax=Dorcoceras hygrometricum TaxID=472368 RepID=A0A2Z7CJJ1_9LAMI|nr:rho GTPase-activating protein 7-like [Dorcoceras hygrometricum]